MPHTDEATIEKLRQQFLNIEMPGMVALINHLWEMEQAGTPVTCIGSSTIDLDGLMDCKNQSEREKFETVFFRLKKLHFGSENRSPLLDIAESVNVLETAPIEARKRVDRILNEFARIAVSVEASLRHTGWSGNEPADFEEVDTMTVDDETSDPTPTRH